MTYSAQDFPSREEFNEWLSHPVSELMLRIVPATALETLKDGWMNGAYTTGQFEGSALQNAEKIGEANVWRLLKELHYNDLCDQLEVQYDRNATDTGGESTHDRS